MISPHVVRWKRKSSTSLDHRKWDFFFFQISFSAYCFQSEPCSSHWLSGLCHWDCLSSLSPAPGWNNPEVAETILKSLKQHLQDRTGMWYLCGTHLILLVVLVMWVGMVKVCSSLPNVG